MAFTDHKISAFTHKISDLADQPNLPPDELKARFDACPEQLRVSLNAVCDEADRLDGRVDGIIAGTFGDSIDKSMLSNELQSELNAKATQTALDAETAAREAETDARESADSALSTRVSSLESAVPQKVQMHFGTYVGNAVASTGVGNRVISLGFTPKVVLVLRHGVDVSHDTWSYGGLALTGYPAMRGNDPALEIVTGGFRAYSGNNSTSGTRIRLNDNGDRYYYLAFQ